MGISHPEVASKADLGERVVGTGWIDGVAAEQSCSTALT